MRKLRASVVLRLVGILVVLVAAAPRSEAGVLSWLRWILMGDVTAPVETWSDEYAAAGVAAALSEYSSEDTTLTLQALARVTQLASEGKLTEASAVAASAAAPGNDPIATMMAAKLRLRVPELPQEEVQGAIGELAAAGRRITNHRIAATAYVDAASATEHLYVGDADERLMGATQLLASADYRLGQARPTSDAERLTAGVLWSEVGNVWARLGPTAAQYVRSTPDPMDRAVRNAESMLQPLASTGAPSSTRAAAAEDLRQMYHTQLAIVEGARGWSKDPAAAPAWQVRLEGLNP